ncbi:TPA: AAA family ATPase [Escherichia coli]|uniref:ATP-dependent nuclease n=1 Tax=Shewanella algae TaxID=38313 RepID=UPI0005CDA211|nr:ATP-binding protein [Shewanella algae]EED0802460.1 AAA family ATPase [Escherichia coli]EKO4252046.1 AAA family ATPase [Vibrio parahaemolyticus]EEQ9036997.1 AAA family ATPase [Escherichia coli]EEY5084610.1 AAA family ATPase [Escherichia coli]EEZ7284355.1 AAA family ATPase [Escherichia coli]
MSVIRAITIQNFRTIKEFKWHPKPGLNCIIGPGDSGKSTILDAIDLTLGARRSYNFTDADFHGLNTQEPIVITVTIGCLDAELMNVEKYGFFLRGFNHTSLEIHDEPQPGDETVLTIKLIVDQDLYPDWRLYSERAESDGLEKRLQWKHKELLSPARLGTTAYQHLAWGNSSILNKLSEDTLDVSATLAELGRQTRQHFADQQVDCVNDVLLKVQKIANGLGVPVGTLKALLDVNGVSLSNGAISLHNDDNTPLRQLGTGSSRLLISGLQKAASKSNIILVDEAEYGLEPYRITRLLNELGSKDTQPTQQVFITTHSPYVLRELQAQQLNVLRKVSLATQVFGNTQESHKLHSLEGTDEQQSTLRVCAESFFSKAVIVCEGKTEIGYVRGIDLHNQSMNYRSINACGVHCADGGGDSMFVRAEVFAKLGYPTAIFKDSDKAQEHVGPSQLAASKGIAIYEWGNNSATEDVLFMACPAQVIPQLLAIAIQRKGQAAIEDHIIAHSQNQITLDACLNHFQEGYRAILAKAANKKSWFKDIEPAETFARNVIAPNYAQFSEALTTTTNQLFQWALEQGD